MGSVATGLLVQIASLISGGIGGAIGSVTSLIKGGAKQLMKFHEEGIAFARDMGMSLSQAQAYTATLTRNTAELAQKYGVAAEQIKAVQRNLSEATNRQLMLNSTQTDGFVALNKLVGDTTVNKFMEELMNGMGGQIDTVQNAVSKAYMTATKNGLNAKKISADIANNLSMMNKLSFRNGVDGLTKMAVQAQKVGLSLQSVEGVAKTFMDFEGSIEHAAQLQMLGGAAGSFGGNPLDMMYEANYDPEALQDRMIKMMSGYAQFDAKTGMSKINGLNMDFVRNIAKAMGMDEGEAVKLAKKNAEIAFKERKLGNMSGLSEEAKNAALNKSYVRDGRVYITDANNKEHDITGGNITGELKNELEQFGKYNNMDELDIMKEQAQSLTTINESIKGFWESAKATFAQYFNKYLPDIQKFIKEIGPVIIQQITPMAKNLAERVGTFLNNGGIDKIINWTKKTVEAIGKIGDFFTSSWPKLIAAILAAKMLGGGKLFGKGLKGLRNSSGASLKKGMSWKKATNAAKASKRATLRAGKSGYRVGSNVTKNLLKNVKWLGKGVKGVAGIGTAIAAVEAGSAIYNASNKIDEINNDVKKTKEQKEKEIVSVKKERNSQTGEAVGALAGGAAGAKAGAVIGSLIAPGIGTVIGGIVGGIGGGLLGGLLGSETGKAVPVGSENNSKTNAKQSFDKGGPVTGVPGEPKIVKAHAGEFVMSQEMVSNFNSFLKNPGLYAMPVGRNDFTYQPGRTEVSKVGDNTVTVKDFNININGTLRLDGGNSSANLDIRQLLNNPTFVGQLTELIRDSISSSYNGGRKMNDLAVMRGLPAQTTTWGRKGG